LSRSGAKLPKIYCVNWFRTDEKGRFVWPGYSENMRVLDWVLRRLDDKADGASHALGTSPRHQDMNWSGLEFSASSFAKITSIDGVAWQQELASHGTWFDQLGDRLPAQLAKKRAELIRRLA
jgi:phosphoenolpyruvate carboxykinase (GTP)